MAHIQVSYLEHLPWLRKLSCRSFCLTSFSFRLLQDNKADVILKYNADEARSLKAYGELPEHGELKQHRLG